MPDQQGGGLVGSASDVANSFEGMRSFGRIVRIDPRTGAEHAEEHEFLRIELAIAWVRWQMASDPAVRGEWYLLDKEGRRRNVAIRNEKQRTAGVAGDEEERVKEKKPTAIGKSSGRARRPAVERQSNGDHSKGVRAVEESYLRELIDASFLIQKAFRPLRFVDTPSPALFSRALHEWEPAALTLSRCRSVLGAARNARLGAADRPMQQITETIETIEVRAERLLFRLDWQTQSGDSPRQQDTDAIIYDIGEASINLRDYAARMLVNLYADSDERAELVLDGKPQIEVLRAEGGRKSRSAKGQASN
ncbi:MAG: hypothetical protein ACYC7A_22355 [Thermoanaerobaculia bacterium]